MTTDDVELSLPVRTGWGKDGDGKADNDKLDKQLRRQFRNLEQWAQSPFVTSIKIQDAAITNAKIDSLSADKITAGSITVNVIISGLLQAPAATGYRVEIGNATYPIRYWNGTTTKFRVDASGNVLLIGEIQNSAGDPIIRQTGYPRAKVVQTNAQTLTTATPTILDWASITTSSDTDSFVVSASDKFEVPFTGQYLVMCQARFEPNTDSTTRRLRVTRNGSNIDELIDARRAHPEAATQPCNNAAIVDFTAGDDIQLEATQWSGINLDVQDWSAQIMFLGDS